MAHNLGRSPLRVDFQTENFANMANSGQPNNNVAKDAAKMMIQELTDFAPHILLFGMLATFVLLGYLQYRFYLSVFSSGFVACFIACIIQCLRFAAGLASANFFKHNRAFLAILVMGLSVWLTWFENQEVTHISTAVADYFAAEGYGQYKDAVELVLRVIVWVGPVLELFMGLTLGVTNSGLQKAHQAELQALQDEISKLNEDLANVPKVDVQQYLDEIEFLKNQMDQFKASNTGNVNAGKPKKPNGKPVKM